MGVLEGLFNGKSFESMDDLEVPPILGNTNIYDISYISMICG
jgi:hypothetical protein